MKRALFVLALFAAGTFILQQNDILAQLSPEEQITAQTLADSLPPAQDVASRSSDLEVLEREVAEETAFEERLLDARIRCEESLRKANRDSKTRTLLQCYRTELQLELALLRPMQLRLRTLSTSDARKELRSRSDNLLQAIATLIDGIDNGVFEEEADAVFSKQRLLEQYRIPYFAARAELLRQALVASVRGIADSIAALPAEEQAAYNARIQCLSAISKTLLEKNTDVKLQQDILQRTHDAMQECLLEVESGTGTTQAV